MINNRSLGDYTFLPVTSQGELLRLTFAPLCVSTD